jgi:hypothetical protein
MGYPDLNWNYVRVFQNSGIIIIFKNWTQNQIWGSNFFVGRKPESLYLFFENQNWRFLIKLKNSWKQVLGRDLIFK